MKDQETLHFEDQDAIVDIAKKSECIVEAKIQLKKEALEKCYKKGVKEVNKGISIPGFRKGKAPDFTVIDRYPSQIDREFRTHVIELSFDKAMTLSKIYPFNKESITKPQLKSCTQESSEMTISYEHSPIVPEIDFSNIHLTKVKKKEISQERVDQMVEQIRRAYPHFEKKEGEVNKGDYVTLSLHTLTPDEKGEKSRNIAIDRRRYAVDENLPPWLLTLLLGMKSEETKEGKTESDPKATEEQKASFKSNNVEVTVHAIFQMSLPEFNDELAQKVGASNTEDALSKIRENLERELQQEQKNEQISQLEEELLKQVKFDIPATMKKDEIEERYSRHKKYLDEMKMSEEERAQKEEEFASQVDANAERALRLYYINRQIASQGGIALSREELKALMQEDATQNPYLYQKGSDPKQIQERTTRLQRLAFQRKVEEYALSQVNG